MMMKLCTNSHESNPCKIFDIKLYIKMKITDIKNKHRHLCNLPTFKLPSNKSAPTKPISTNCTTKNSVTRPIQYRFQEVSLPGRRPRPWTIG